MTNRYSRTVVTEIILDVSGRSNKAIYKILKKLNEATGGEIAWTESGESLDGWEPNTRIFRLIYDVEGGDMSLGMESAYTTPNETLYKRIPSWISAIVKQRSKQ